ncbi:hypothetical protein [Parasediminibacterium sp. JCM 36343]|uniref:hypothetical protein n=1 Tax=Parasediminibacterium sp. JCM 36343 TaxID=3374279 RepID=UPI00397BA3C7
MRYYSGASLANLPRRQKEAQSFKRRRKKKRRKMMLSITFSLIFLRAALSLCVLVATFLYITI